MDSCSSADWNIPAEPASLPYAKFSNPSTRICDGFSPALNGCGADEWVWRGQGVWVGVQAAHLLRLALT
jgi:hypothetical protein